MADESPKAQILGGYAACVTNALSAFVSLRRAEGQRVPPTDPPGHFGREHRF